MSRPHSPSPAMQRPRSATCACGFAAVFALAAAVAVVVPATADAQLVVRGAGSASVSVPVRMTVPVRLLLAPDGDERTVAVSGSHREIELPVKVAANLAWAVSVALPGDHDGGEILALTPDGEWKPLGTAPITVIRGDAPQDPTAMALRLRIPRESPGTASLRLRLSIAGGAEALSGAF